jgi:hypothetical protein
MRSSIRKSLLLKIDRESDKEIIMGKNTITVKVKNNTGETITAIQYRHRYDEDVYNDGDLSVLDKGATSPIGSATYWTDFLRTGKDYWWIQFNKGGTLYTCKANFYCYLTSGDADNGGSVILELSSDKMKVIPPVSSSCSVRLYTSDELQKLITEEHVKSGVAEKNLPEDPSKKCSSVD